MFCCGRKHKSKFCPDCGQEIGANRQPESLIAECRRQEAVLNDAVSEMASAEGLTDKQAKALKQKRAMANQWGIWAGIVEDLIRPRGSGYVVDGATKGSTDASDEGELKLMDVTGLAEAIESESLDTIDVEVSTPEEVASNGDVHEEAEPVDHVPEVVGGGRKRRS